MFVVFNFWTYSPDLLKYVIIQYFKYMDFVCHYLKTSLISLLWEIDVFLVHKLPNSMCTPYS
jgi:hypothetical protein